jgi:ferredoxin
LGLLIRNLPLNLCFKNLKKLDMAYVISDDCTACGTCIDECPVEAITEGDIYVIDPELCTDCAACADVCPVEAISPE